MKRLFVGLACVVLVGLWGCGEGTDVPSMEVATQVQTVAAPTPPETVQTDYVFDRDFARTPTHFYSIQTEQREHSDEIALYRAPLSNISKQEELPLPLAEGETFDEIIICGVTREWLFVCVRYYDQKLERYSTRSVCRVSLKTGEANELFCFDEPYNSVWYNAASDSFLFACREDDRMWLEAMPLKDGKRRVVFSDDKFFKSVYDDRLCNWWYWYNTDDGMVLFEAMINDCQESSNYVIVDSENKAAPTSFVGIEHNFGMFYGNDTYMMCRLEDHPKEDEPVIEWSVKDFCVFDENGKCSKTIASFAAGEGGYIFLLPFGDMIMMKRRDLYGSAGGSLLAVYDPATGASFSTERTHND